MAAPIHVMSKSINWAPHAEDLFYPTFYVSRAEYVGGDVESHVIRSLWNYPEMQDFLKYNSRQIIDMVENLILVLCGFRRFRPNGQIQNALPVELPVKIEAPDEIPIAKKRQVHFAEPLVEMENVQAAVKKPNKKKRSSSVVKAKRP